MWLQQTDGLNISDMKYEGGLFNAAGLLYRNTAHANRCYMIPDSFIKSVFRSVFSDDAGR